MINLETIKQWLNAPAETERLEFKEAKQSYDKEKLFKYCVALGTYLMRAGEELVPMTPDVLKRIFAPNFKRTVWV